MVFRTLSYNVIISQYSFNKFYEMFEEVKNCKQYPKSYATHHHRTHYVVNVL